MNTNTKRNTKKHFQIKAHLNIQKRWKKSRNSRVLLNYPSGFVSLQRCFAKVFTPLIFVSRFLCYKLQCVYWNFCDGPRKQNKIVHGGRVGGKWNMHVKTVTGETAHDSELSLYHIYAHTGWISDILFLGKLAGKHLSFNSYSIGFRSGLWLDHFKTGGLFSDPVISIDWW